MIGAQGGLWQTNGHPAQICVGNQIECTGAARICCRSAKRKRLAPCEDTAEFEKNLKAAMK